MDRLFDTYAELRRRLHADCFREQFPEGAGRLRLRLPAGDQGQGVRRRCAASCPAATLSNVGIYGTGQGYEPLLLRMRAHPLPEARAYADLMLDELRKVIPSFLKRVDLDRPRRGVERRTSRTTRDGHGRRRRPRCSRRRPSAEPAPVGARSSTSIPTARTSSSPRCSTRTRTCPRTRSSDRVRAHVAPTSGSRSCGPTWASARNRRHKPGRALERIDYRFDVLADYGAFRDLQRHRMLTIEWQPLTPRHGYTRPEAVDDAGARRPRSTTAMERSAALYDALVERFPAQAPYAVSPRLPGALRRCR